ncbi:MAG: penicillin-binding protein 2 [Proteobacteria bacterium]|nr:penicillin-binding protein 2 [Pseudomonadota bacterium]MBU1741319.1 penicillin-binding protein 2 [Pseudomonadota bacterium]
MKRRMYGHYPGVGRGRDNGDDSLWPFVISALIVALCFVFLLGRLWYLQVIKGPVYAQRSESNRIRVHDILPSRGFIYSADAKLLVENRLSYALAVVREDVPDRKKLLGELERLIGLDPRKAGRILRRSKRPVFRPVKIKTNISRDEVALLETYKSRLPGVVILVEPKRAYLFPRLAPHVIGYLSEINARELESGRYPYHKLADFVGRSGVERSFDRYLSGSHGRRQVEVDATGRVVKVLKQIHARPGFNIYLTIDSRLQRAVQRALRGKVGAIVALDPHTGRVLAMASNPFFNPNRFVVGLKAAQWRSLTRNPLHPLYNRAVRGQYPPGSTFKIVTALAALHRGVIGPETVISCGGRFPLGSHVFHCYGGHRHGPLKVRRAITVSCDVFFYNLGHRMGIDRLAEVARMFGLGSKTGIALEHEKTGVAPDRAWKRGRILTRGWIMALLKRVDLGSRFDLAAPLWRAWRKAWADMSWRGGDTLSVAIGQGYNLVTPLQMAMVVAAVANGAREFVPRPLWLYSDFEHLAALASGAAVVYRPQLVWRITDINGQLVKDLPPRFVRRLPFSVEYLQLIQRGLIGVVNEPGGTAPRARLKAVTVAGKTGTAQVVGLAVDQLYGGRQYVPRRFRDHGWFVAYAPAEDPRIAVAVVVEHAGLGGRAAAPLARYVIGKYLGLPVNLPDKLSPRQASWFDRPGHRIGGPLPEEPR